MAYANHRECNAGHCRYTDSVPVRAVVNFTYKSTYYGAKVDGVLGVMTTYCENKDSAHACPPWVDTALANPVGKDVSGSGAMLSYEPLTYSVPSR